ncbi:MAG: hypothetical protein PWP38_1836 [Clostridiales bacterium]|nr:hypothetical protein [Clostridiales bacterium]
MVKKRTKMYVVLMLLILMSTGCSKENDTAASISESEAESSTPVVETPAIETPTSETPTTPTSEPAVTEAPTTPTSEPAVTEAPTTPSPETTATETPATPSPETAATEAPTTPSPETAATEAPTTPSPETAATETPATPAQETEVSSEAPQAAETADTNGNEAETEEEIEMMETNTMNITVNGTVLTATLADNSSAEALVALLREAPIVIDMRDYGNMEKVGGIGTSLPTNNEQITTEAGDLILYQGSALVIYYEPNSWNFTRLGKLNDISKADLKKLLGTGSVQVTLSLPE